MYDAGSRPAISSRSNALPHPSITLEEKNTMEQKLYDKNGREILPFDLLKVFHFIGARRKRHYMYKHALEYMRRPNGMVFLVFSHLNHKGEKYLELADGRHLEQYEIVQGYDKTGASFESRPIKRKRDDDER